MSASRDLVTGRGESLHVADMVPALTCPRSLDGESGEVAQGESAVVGETVVGLYDQHFDFVWRSLRRLGVAGADLEDAAQDVFVVVHRRLASFERRASIRTWIFGIALRVAKLYRQRNARQRERTACDEALLVCPRGTPEEVRASMQAAERVQSLLEEMDDDKRAVFVLAELEHMPASEIATALGIPMNTVYSRLRLARGVFENGLRRIQAKDDWRYR